MQEHVQACLHVNVILLSFLLGDCALAALRSSSLEDIVNYGLDKGVTHKAKEFRAINIAVVINTLRSNVYVSVLA